MSVCVFVCVCVCVCVCVQVLVRVHEQFEGFMSGGGGGGEIDHQILMAVLRTLAKIGPHADPVFRDDCEPHHPHTLTPSHLHTPLQSSSPGCQQWRWTTTVQPTSPRGGTCVWLSSTPTATSQSAVSSHRADGCSHNHSSSVCNKA